MSMGMNSTREWWLALALVFACILARSASGIYLDQDQNISLRARIYSQASIRTNDSQIGTLPQTEDGQVVQHRNFYNPELDAELTSYTTWMKGTFLDVLAPDEFSGRLAAWGFYDGLYDYGPGQFHAAERLVNSTFGNFAARPRQAWFLESPTVNTNGKTLAEVFPGSEAIDLRNVYASQRRVNELYLNYAKGPVFVRIGRQSISWGESDTIALLDQNNPFDQTIGPPGIFEDTDEARIPLWTIRTSVSVFDTLGPLSSGFVEAYWVPGDLDVNTGFTPFVTASSPYVPRVPDPQTQIPTLNGLPLLQAQFVLVDHVPQKRFEESRYGFRTQTVIARNYTVSAWFYTHFPSEPVPRAVGLVKVGGNGTCGKSGTECLTITETVHELTPVMGVANSFFLEPLDGIVRMEAEYFNREPGFVAQSNLNIGKGLLDPITEAGHVEHADFLRWELGFDRFFFIRPVNPTNSFSFVAAWVGSWNLSETSRKDFQYAGQFKPSFFEKPPGTSPTPADFVQLEKVESFVQAHLQTDYLHGRLTPGMTVIQNLRGTYVINPTVTYRWTDWMLFTLNYITVGGAYQEVGFFRDRDQISMRATYQLN